MLVIFPAIIFFANPHGLSSENLFNNLTWNPNSEPNLTGYKIYRSTNSGNYTKGNPYATVPTGTTIYVDNSIESEVTYYYAVTAVNSYDLESSFSNEVNISKSSEEDLPQLSNGNVTPTSGSTTTDFIFSVHFSDPGGQTPTLARVFIGDVSNTMTLAGGSVNDGDYTFTKKLGKANHTFYFFFTDSSMNEVRFPESGTLSGPSVGSNKPDKPKNVKFKNK